VQLWVLDRATLTPIDAFEIGRRSVSRHRDPRSRRIEAMGVQCSTRPATPRSGVVHRLEGRRWVLDVEPSVEGRDRALVSYRRASPSPVAAAVAAVAVTSQGLV